MSRRPVTRRYRPNRLRLSICSAYPFTEWFDTDHNQLDHNLARFAPQMSLSALRHDLCRLADQLGAAHLVTTHSQNGARP